MQRLRAVTRVGLFMIIVMASTSTTQAQTLGLYGGLNFSSVDNVDFEDVPTSYDNRTGFHLGAYVDINSGILWLRPGVRYSRAGALFEGLSETIGGAAFNDRFDVNIFSVPVDLRLEFDLPLAKPYIFGGPELQFQTAPDIPEALEDDFRTLGLSGTTGAGVRIVLPRSDIAVVPEIRYSFGLRGMMDDRITIAGAELEPDDAQTVNRFLVTAGVEF